MEECATIEFVSKGAGRIRRKLKERAFEVLPCRVSDEAK